MITASDRSARRVCLAFAAAKLLLHLCVNALGGYGYFRDESYYVACSEHLSAGYVDLPPLSIFLLAAQRAMLGDSVFSLRLLPALAGAAALYLTGRLALRMGASFGGTALACLAYLCSPILLAFGGIYSMNAFDPLLWISAAHLLLSLLRAPSMELWLALGAVCGLGLLNKINSSWLVGGIFVGLLISGHRRLLCTPGPWVAAAIALVFFSPFVIWNLQHDLAHLEFIRAASEGKYASLSWSDFLLGQITAQNPLAVPFWLLGLYFLLISAGGAPYRPLGWIWLTACLVLVFHGHSKPEYLACAFPILFAAGGAAWPAARAYGLSRIRTPLYGGLLLTGTIFIAPMVLPLLPVEKYISWAETLGVRPSTSEGKQLSRLPQFYADMFGWEEKVDAAVRAFEALSPAERERCAIFASNYGRCGALDLLGKTRGLPPSIGSHNSYWIWGPRDYSGELMLVLSDSMGGRESMFESVVEVEEVAPNEYAMPYENGLKVFLCRGLRRPMSELWPELKQFE